MKKFLLPLVAILTLPYVAAEGGLVIQGFVSVTGLILGKVGSLNDALIKLAIFAVLFAVFAKSLGKWFEGNNSAANIIAVIIAILAVRLMPGIWIAALGKFLWVAAIVIIPYLVINIVVSDWSLLKIILLIAAYFGVYLLVAGAGFWGFGFFPMFVADFRYFYHVYSFQTIIVIAGMIAYFSLRWSGKDSKRI